MDYLNNYYLFSICTTIYEYNNIAIKEIVK